jgi:hypothetical protein
MTKPALAKMTLMAVLFALGSIACQSSNGGTIVLSKVFLSVGEPCRTAPGRPRSCRRSALDRVSGA